MVPHTHSIWHDGDPLQGSESAVRSLNGSLTGHVRLIFKGGSLESEFSQELPHDSSGDTSVDGRVIIKVQKQRMISSAEYDSSTHKFIVRGKNRFVLVIDDQEDSSFSSVVFTATPHSEEP